MLGWRRHRAATRDRLLARVTFADGPPSIELVPIRRDDDHVVEVVALGTEHGRRIAGQVAELSRTFGTEVAPAGDGLAVRPL